MDDKHPLAIAVKNLVKTHQRWLEELDRTPRETLELKDQKNLLKRPIRRIETRYKRAVLCFYRQHLSRNKPKDVFTEFAKHREKGLETMQNVAKCALKQKHLEPEQKRLGF